MTTTDAIILVGAGPLARDYARVLMALGERFVAVGRSQDNCAAFELETGHRAESGGVEVYLKAQRQFTPSRAIIVTQAEDFEPIIKVLINHGVREILLEKPGGINRASLTAIDQWSADNQVKIWVAYNRRFYSSTIKAAEYIAADNGIKSFNFEFTEWKHAALKANLPEKTLANLLLCNSSHVIDLAFYLGGWPEEWSVYAGQKCDWCEGYATHAGAGRSSKEALFTYQANWMSPGRWGVECLTERHRLILRPLEQLHIQKTASIAIDKLELDDDDDFKFKPGLYKQMKAFLYGDGACNLKSISDQVKSLDVYERIAGRAFR